MKLAKGILAAALGALVFTSVAGAAPYRMERVTGGLLDLAWQNGYNTSNSMQPLTLDASHPAYNNPSGDHTVGVATNSIPDSGGICVSITSAQGQNDYVWEGWIFTGDGNTRRGLLVRATPFENARNFYMLVIESGLFQVRFRTFADPPPGSPPNTPPTVVTLGSWLANTFPSGIPAVNTWHHMKVIAVGNQFRCFWDGHELNGATPIVDSTHPTGDVGVYNFRFDLGNVPVYFDDLYLSLPESTPAKRVSMGALKQLYK
uniref:LamG domain-containing protein n=1 Tax=Eiseniibacteriota bacterium TaxID=2212470 RepID=A0A832I8T5_UNCEI